MLHDAIALPHDVQFTTPQKCIFDSQGTADFQSSIAMARLKWALNKYLHMVESRPLPAKTYSARNETIRGVVSILARLAEVIDETPPLEGPRRFGNFACRDWHRKVDTETPQLVSGLFSRDDHKSRNSICELNYYLLNSLGSALRLDYGTGHELSFVAFICALDLLGLLNNATGDDILLVFDSYYTLIQKLILTYTLEPAGSHGVWGLDDHFHYLYILGSSQMIHSTEMAAVSPRDISNKATIQSYADTNLYLKGINFIFKVKNGPFKEHSPLLYDISRTVSQWTKVETGLLKMYYAEVLSKFPVVQHFWFGSGFFPWVDMNNGNKLPIREQSADNEESSNQRLDKATVKNNDTGFPRHHLERTLPSNINAFTHDMRNTTTARFLRNGAYNNTSFVDKMGDRNGLLRSHRPPGDLPNVSRYTAASKSDSSGMKPPVSTKVGNLVSKQNRKQVSE